MPEVSQQVTVTAPLATTWQFVADLRNWADLMPGHRGMTVVNAADSEWKIQGDVGILSKLVTLDVHVTEWVERDHVSFTLRCREEPLEARGRLQAESESPSATRLMFFLAAQGGGMLGPVVNALLGKVLPGMADQLARGIKERIEAGWRPAATPA